MFTGWAKFRFIANNPGIWYFHCHIDWHMAAGLNMIIIEAPFQLHAGYASGQIVVPQSHKDICTYDNKNLAIVRPAGEGSVTVSATATFSDQLIITIASIVGGIVLVMIMIASYYYYSRSNTAKAAGSIELSTISKSEDNNNIDITRVTSSDELMENNSNGVILEGDGMIFVDQSRL